MMVKYQYPSLSSVAMKFGKPLKFFNLFKLFNIYNIKNEQLSHLFSYRSALFSSCSTLFSFLFHLKELLEFKISNLLNNNEFTVVIG